MAAMPRERLYLDHAATTPLAPEAREALLPLLDARYGNASSPHLEGRAAKDALEDARRRVAAALGCRPREVVFTSGATEGATIALHGAAWTLAAAGRTRVVLGAVEHPAVAETADAIGAMGLEVVRVPVAPDGRVDADAFLEAADERTAVAALMLANHESGALQPVAEVAGPLAERGVPLVCDAALGPGRVDVRQAALPVPLLLLSAHKCGGPAGAGALVVRRGTRLTPFLRGGVQEERLRPGTENVAACAAFAAALERACAEQGERAARYDDLVRTFLDGLAGLEGWSRVGPSEATLPGLVTLELQGVEGEAAMINMDLEGIAIATGSTCALGSSDPSPSLLAMGFSRRRAASTVRVSVGEGTAHKHAERAASTLCHIARRLRSLAHR
jgi:cysteine desulfurase